MRTILLLVLWTWGLTPLWVNIVSTVFISVDFLVAFGKAYKKLKETADEM